MTKSSRYNQQQTKPKQCRSEVEELHIHQNLETGHCDIYESENKYKEIMGVPCRLNFAEELYVSESKEVRELHETINF